MARRKKRIRRDIEPLGAVLTRDKTMTRLIAEPTSAVSRHDWEGGVGTRIAARARPARLEGGTLSVLVATAAWSQELSLLSESILEQLRRRGVQVTALRFRVGKLEQPVMPARRPAKIVPHAAPLPAQLTAQIADVADPDLREAIRTAARKALSYCVSGR